MDDILGLILSAPASYAFARFHILMQPLLPDFDNLELALVNDKDTDPTRYVKAIYEKYELGAKTRGKDLASQFLTWIFVGSHARGGGVGKRREPMSYMRSTLEGY